MRLFSAEATSAFGSAARAYVRRCNRFRMIDDHIRVEAESYLPLGIKQSPHQRSDLFEKLEASSEPFSSCDSCFPLSSVQQRQKFSRQAHEANVMLCGHPGELDGSNKLNLMTSGPQTPSKGDIGLNIAACTERMDRDPHGVRIKYTTRNVCLR